MDKTDAAMVPASARSHLPEVAHRHPAVGALASTLASHPPTDGGEVRTVFLRRGVNVFWGSEKYRFTTTISPLTLTASLN